MSSERHNEVVHVHVTCCGNFCTMWLLLHKASYGNHNQLLLMSVRSIVCVSCRVPLCSLSKEERLRKQPENT